MTDIITAIATGIGGSIGIIRLSGAGSLNIGEIITKKQIKPRFAYYGNFYNATTIIDKGIVIFFNSPNSFTGEDVVEFHCHGGDINTQNVLNLTIKLGARLAEPGEFSKRAFLNGKIDLTQAEAISDLINAKSSVANKLAMRSLNGEFATNVNNIRTSIINLRAFIETSIDFVEDDIDFIQNNESTTKLNDIKDSLIYTINACQNGLVLKNGINIAIVGKPNVGKSSLLNALTGEQTAIVTKVAGTTRDSITETLNIDGINISITDTAGIRKSANIIESEGIKRAKIRAANADIVLLVCNANEEPDQTLIPKLATRVIVVQNKIDIYTPKKIKGKYEVISISAKYNKNLMQLKELITKNTNIDYTQNIFLARQRHINHLNQTLLAINNALNEMEKHNFELVAEELNIAQKNLNYITGKFTNEDLLGVIFSSFCIGK